MANKLLDLCIDVEATGVVVSLHKNGDSDTPANPPYWFQVYCSQEADFQPVAGPSVTLTQTGKCRVVAWDALPSSPPTVKFSGATWIANGVLLELDGGDFSIGSASTYDPWPPT